MTIVNKYHNPTVKDYLSVEKKKEDSKSVTTQRHRVKKE